MTVSYQYDVASSTSGGLVKLLLRWRGSVWKMIYRELIVFSASYLILTVLYRFVLDEHNKRIFEKIVHFFSTFVELIPLSFILGFYVSFTGTRWWSQYRAIPWPDKIMNIIALYVSGADESSRMLRRTLMRYLNLSLVLVLRSISMAVKRRFPTKDHLIEAGFLTKAELEMFLSVPSVEFNTFWIPCTWFINLLREARQECRITDSNGLKLIMEEAWHIPMIFLCEWDRKARSCDWVKKQWPFSVSLILGSKNIERESLVDTKKVPLPPLCMKLGMMK